MTPLSFIFKFNMKKRSLFSVSLSYILSMFLNFGNFQSQCSYKQFYDKFLQECILAHSTANFTTFYVTFISVLKFFLQQM